MDPDLSLTDGFVTLRRQRPDDIESHLAAIDDEQIDWLWEPGDRALYEARTPEQQRAGHLQHLHAMYDGFGPGPKWSFSGDVPGFSYAVYIDCDLANPHVPHGQANISYTTHPAFRRRGYTSRAVRLACRFLRENTTAYEAHIIRARPAHGMRSPE